MDTRIKDLRQSVRDNKNYLKETDYLLLKHIEDETFSVSEETMEKRRAARAVINRAEALIAELEAAIQDNISHDIE